ncbi:IS3 family transposase, partial [Escherichia coli]|uniref:IS3 family transposase n=1 Tax=Escherichia coli TaxID=562 RepID=UPI003F7A819D
DLRLTGQIKQFWLESGCVYGYRKIHLDLRDSGQQCGVNRVWRLMKRVGIKALNRPGFPGECFICELRLPDHRFRWKH